jgi:hypothetical protein
LESRKLPVLSRFPVIYSANLLDREIAREEGFGVESKSFDKSG